MTVLLVHCTCPDADTAARIARVLIEERLAACVNRIEGVRSTYQWQGTVADEAEVLLAIKTTRARYDALCERIVALHPYELPEVIAVEVVAGLDRYLDWVGAQTRA